jgi:hypothetical protein
VEQFESDLLQESTGIDEASIFYCKSMIAEYLYQNQQQLFNEISLQDAVMFTNEHHK